MNRKDILTLIIIPTILAAFIVLISTLAQSSKISFEYIINKISKVRVYKKLGVYEKRIKELELVFELYKPDDIKEFIESLKMKEEISNIYRTGHPFQCNCVNKCFEGWIFELIEEDNTSMFMLTVCGEMLYTYSHYTKYNGLYETRTFILEQSSLDYLIRLFKRYRTDINDKNMSWFSRRIENKLESE